jgi:hypothetical protein
VETVQLLLLFLHDLAELVHALAVGFDVFLVFLVRHTLQTSPSAIVTTVRLAATEYNLQAAGYSLDRIGSHSLRASGAMALKLNGYDETTIKKLGRWSSDTYLKYIQTQIGALTAGVASAMARPLRFHNVAAAA